MFLISVESYRGEGSRLPGYRPVLFTVTALFCILVAIEIALRWVFVSVQAFHPILQDETSRNILARNIGVNALSCFVVSYMGLKARHVLRDFWGAIASRGRSGVSGAYDSRLFEYHPEGARILVFFVSFQIKNLVDSIQWNEGPEFIAHHIFAIFSAGGGLVPGAFHFYAIFYMGISEFSTGILTLLASFDDDLGVEGLSEAFPMVKVVLGSLFLVSFVVFRVFLWGSLTCIYFQDIRNAFRVNHSKLVGGRRTFAWLNSVSLGFITLLQVIWLFEVFRVAKLEMKQLGWL